MSEPPFGATQHNGEGGYEAVSLLWDEIAGGDAVGHYAVNHLVDFARDGVAHLSGALHVAAEQRAEPHLVARGIFDDQVEPALNQRAELGGGRGLGGHRGLQLLAYSHGFGLKHGLIDVAFGAEIGVKRTPPAVGSRGDVVHCGILNALTGKELACHINEPFACT